MTPQSPRALAIRLAKTTTDDGMIIAHVKREFGVTYDKQDIARIRSTRPIKFGRSTPVEMAYADRVIRTPKADPFLIALLKYRLKYSLMTPKTREIYSAMVAQ